MKCSCCERESTKDNPWDGLYSSCSACAFEHSLEHFPCDHGAERERERAPRCDHTTTIADGTGLTVCCNVDCRKVLKPATREDVRHIEAFGTISVEIPTGGERR